jgi:hypothetical protein
MRLPPYAVSPADSNHTKPSGTETPESDLIPVEASTETAKPDAVRNP